MKFGTYIDAKEFGNDDVKVSRENYVAHRDRKFIPQLYSTPAAREKERRNDTERESSNDKEREEELDEYIDNNDSDSEEDDDC